MSTPKQASSIDLVPDFIPNTSVISENDNSEFILPLPNIDHGNVGTTDDHISNVNIGQEDVVHEQPIDGTPVVANNEAVVVLLLVGYVLGELLDRIVEVLGEMDVVEE